jgi:hypothetical protein
VAGVYGYGPQPTNLFRSYYTNPYSLGYGPLSGRAVFGQALTSTLSPTTGLGATGLPTGVTGAIAPGGFATSSIGVYRAPAYTTTIGFARRPLSPGILQRRVRAVLNRSSALGSRRRIRARVVGRTVILRGQVADLRERRLAEALVRLEPGVQAVRNEIRVRPIRIRP